LIDHSREGSRLNPVSLAALIRSSYPGWRGRGVGPPGIRAALRVLVAKGLVSVAVGSFEQRQLSAGVRVFSAHDHPHPGRPVG
jgi:hypothetical protein